jgi:thioredoxin-dependent peroxiredoxin
MKLCGLLCVALLMGATLGVQRSYAAGGMPAIGQTAPEFSLPSQDGTSVSLKDFRGQWVVLYFYPKDNTPGCTIEAHNFQQDLPKYEKERAVILGVSIDTTDSHKDFCARQGLTFKLLADTHKKVVVEYGSLKSMMGIQIAARNTFLIDPDGKIVKEWLGVDPNKHSSEVLTELDSQQKK